MSNSIGGPAEQRAIIQFGHGCVRDDGGCAGPGDMTGGNVDALGGIVERPAELNLRRVRVHLARYVCLFLFRHPVNLRLIRLAGGRDWNDQDLKIVSALRNARIHRIYRKKKKKQFFFDFVVFSFHTNNSRKYRAGKWKVFNNQIPACLSKWVHLEICNDSFYC